MSHKLSPAVDALEEDLQKQMEEVAGTKRLINSLLKKMGEQPRYDDVEEYSGTVRADEYYGQTVTGAAIQVLKRAGKALSIFDITKALAQGGFDFAALKWQPDQYNRNVAISLGKNPQLFHKLPNGSWGLPEWYPGVVAAKKTPAKQDKDSAPTEPTDVSPKNETAPTKAGEGDS